MKKHTIVFGATAIAAAMVVYHGTLLVGMARGAAIFFAAVLAVGIAITPERGRMGGADDSWWAFAAYATEALTVWGALAVSSHIGWSIAIVMTGIALLLGLWKLVSKYGAENGATPTAPALNHNGA